MKFPDKIIDSIQLPDGLRSLSISDLEKVCLELREELISSVAESGGHFASSLGATELSVALHHSFNTPDDKLIFDVGHQCYVHKMLTGRRELLSSIRTKGGISGFLKREESEFDVFGAGHAGTSISAGVGISIALERSGKDAYAVSIIGDGSMTAGMAFEALNHAGALGLKKFIVVLNDNEMSISPNVGAVSWLFSKVRTSKTSTYARKHFKRLHDQGYVPDFLYRAIDKAEEATQGFFATPAMLFESFGFRYIGPVDGHNVSDLVQALENAKVQEVPTIVHAVTTKGKGYIPAEEDPVTWHGVSPFNVSRGEFVKKAPTAPTPSYTSIFSRALIDLCKENKKIIGITAAMPSGTGLDKLQEEVPESFYDVGICEQHAVTFAAGLAAEGMKPVCAIYSTFLQRGYDQVVHDVCVQNLPVVFAMDRGGLVGNDGETHQGVFDISFLRCLPNMTIMAPKDEAELRNMLKTATDHDGPVALRYPRGNGIGVEMQNEFSPIPIGKGEIVQKGNTILLLCLGPVTYTALEVAKEIESEFGIRATVINARFVKPLDKELLLSEIPKHSAICTIEDHALHGGFGSAVLEMLSDHGLSASTLLRFGVRDSFVTHASQSEQAALNGIDKASIHAALRSLLSGLELQAAV